MKFSFEDAHKYAIKNKIRDAIPIGWFNNSIKNNLNQINIKNDQNRINII